MFIKKKTIVNDSFKPIKIDVLASDNTECQIQVETEFEEFFFDLSQDAANSLRDFLTEFTSNQNQIKNVAIEFMEWSKTYYYKFDTTEKNFEKFLSQRKK